MEHTNLAYPIDLAELLTEINIGSKSQIVNHIEKLQEQLITDLCGPKYSRNHLYTRE